MEKNPGPILIVGCGYLGERAGRLLRARGERAIGTSTRAERLREIERAGLEAALLNLSRPGESSVWREPIAAVVHAAAPGKGGDARLVFRDGPLACARKFLENQRNAGGASPGRFIFVSSTGVYPQEDGSEVDESSPAEPSPSDPAAERHRLLREGEDALLELARREGLPAAILRLGGLYGPGRSPIEWLRRPEMRERLARGSEVAWMNWLHIDDAAAAILLALDRARPGEIYLITDGTPVRRGDFLRRAAELASQPPLVLTGSPTDRGKRCAIAKARRELGFTPRYPSFQEGLEAVAG